MSIGKRKTFCLLMSIDNRTDRLSTKTAEVSKHAHTVHTESPTMDSFFSHFKSINPDDSVSSSNKAKHSCAAQCIRQDKEKQIIENHSNLLQKITFWSSFFLCACRRRKKHEDVDEINVVLCLLLHKIYCKQICQSMPEWFASFFLHVVMGFFLSHSSSSGNQLQ